MNYANRLDIPYVCIIGEDEQNNEKATIKNMNIGEQITVEKDKIIENLK